MYRCVIQMRGIMKTENMLASAQDHQGRCARLVPAQGLQSARATSLTSCSAYWSSTGPTASWHAAASVVDRQAKRRLRLVPKRMYNGMVFISGLFITMYINLMTNEEKEKRNRNMVVMHNNGSESTLSYQIEFYCTVVKERKED